MDSRWELRLKQRIATGWVWEGGPRRSPRSRSHAELWALPRGTVTAHRHAVQRGLRKARTDPEPFPAATEEALPNAESLTCHKDGSPHSCGFVFPLPRTERPLKGSIKGNVVGMVFDGRSLRAPRILVGATCHSGPGLGRRGEELRMTVNAAVHAGNPDGPRGPQHRTPR